MFCDEFQRLTGHEPFPWQARLCKRFCEGDIPAALDIPTGLGKTAVIAIWLIALAKHPGKMPRRLVYVVNRRTVVDQTTVEVGNLRARLLKQKEWPEQTRDLAISTLRGQFEDNREWSANPSRPAVICGTVDMIGSRLLFGGYGVGFKTRPMHAGFLGQDVLLVHDEAHLEPAFQTLIEGIQKEQKRCGEFGRFHVMQLTATPQKGGEAFTLDEQDRAHRCVRERVEAAKTLVLHEEEEKKPVEQMVALAKAHEGAKAAVLVFVRKVEDVSKIVAKLPGDRVCQLTGTMRGLERDALVEHPILRRLGPKAEGGEDTVYLVCTSAGEVGGGHLGGSHGVRPDAVRQHGTAVWAGESLRAAAGVPD